MRGDPNCEVHHFLMPDGHCTCASAPWCRVAVRTVRTDVADEHNDWEDDTPTKPGVKPLTNEEMLGLDSTQYRLDREIPTRLLSKEQLTEMLEQERARSARLVRALTAIRLHPDHADAIAVVALRTVEP